MKIKIGTFEVVIDVKNPSSSDILELKLKEIINANNISISQARDSSNESSVKEPLNTKISGTSTDKKDYSAQVEALHAAGFTDKTIVMVATKVLGVTTLQTKLVQNFGLYERASARFLERPIDDDIWALIAAPIQLPGEPYKVCILGLNEQNQIIILSIKENPPAKGFRDVINRGLDPDKIKLGILSFHLGSVTDFQELFPQAQVQLDWQEYIDLSVGAETKIKLREVSKPEEAEELIESIKAPRELLTYLDFPKELQRALKTTTPIKRIEKDIHSKLKKKGVPSEMRKLVLDWSLLRLQFHWLKVPIDSNQLANLKYIKSRNETDLDNE